MSELDNIILSKRYINEAMTKLAILEKTKAEIETKIKSLKGLIKGNKISIRCSCKKLADLNYKF